jgi:hypothetical protein
MCASASTSTASRMSGSGTLVTRRTMGDCARNLLATRWVHSFLEADYANSCEHGWPSDPSCSEQYPIFVFHLRRYVCLLITHFRWLSVRRGSLE